MTERVVFSYFKKIKEKNTLFHYKTRIDNKKYIKKIKKEVKI